MKYSETLVNKTMKAVENNPIHTFWKIHKHSQCIDLEFCGIRFENTDSVVMELNICGTEVNALVFTDASRNGYKWIASCNLKAVNNDSYMMWLGYVLDKMEKFASTVDI